MTAATRRGVRTAAARTSAPPRIVVVTRASEYEGLLRRHATAQQAAFFLEQRGSSLEEVRARHERMEHVLAEIRGALPADWRRAHVRRADLDRFLFEPSDVVVAVGQDGLVANTAKYLEGQSVIGLNPDPERYEGVLVPHAPVRAAELMHAAVDGTASHEARTMVEGRLDDGRHLLALNELFVGHRSHQSARYVIAYGKRREQQSSSGLIVSTGTGVTGWARSIALSRGCTLRMPEPEDRALVFFVREAWPSVATGADLVEGVLRDGRELAVTSRMEAGGVVFGDGIESDRIELAWGQRISIRRSRRTLRLVV
ncbi:MAG: hypothetical protein QNJ90_01525 [Planctomycetota bacterium]|nr:hypothetical protein [Planctomycetota bacterium]